MEKGKGKRTFKYIVGTIFVLLNAHYVEVMIGCVFIYWQKRQCVLHIKALKSTNKTQGHAPFILSDNQWNVRRGE